MQLKPFKEMLSLGKEKLAEMMAPMRAGMVKAKAQLEMYKLDEQILSKEAAIQEMFASFSDEKKVDFPKLMDMLDDLEIMTARKKQYESVLGQLFPDDPVF